MKHSVLLGRGYRRALADGSCAVLWLAWLVGVASLPAGVGAEEAAQVWPVKVVEVERVSTAVPVTATGLWQRREEADLSVKIGGRVETVHVRAGEAVKRGQVLLRLDTEEIDAQVAIAELGVEKAKRDLARVLALRAEQVATAEAEQDTRTVLELAEAQLRVARFNRRHAEVVAPADGKILRRNVEPEEWVAPGRILLRFASEDEGWLVKANVAESQAARLQVGNIAEVALSLPNAPRFMGRILQMAEAVDPVTRTTPVEVEVTGAVEGVRSGAVANLWIHPAAARVHSVVPASALLEGKERRCSLYVVASGGKTVRREEVTVEAWWEGRAYLMQELPPGTQVVMTGAEYLRDGAAIAVQP